MSKTWYSMLFRPVGAGLLMAFGACGNDESATPGPDVAADTHSDARGDTRPETTPWIYAPGDTDEAPTLAAATIETAIDEALAVATSLDPRPIAALHEALLPTPALGEGDLTGCPAYLTYDINGAVAFFWQGECTAADGHTFSGNGVFGVFSELRNELGVFSGANIQMSGRITAPDGTFLEGSGTAVYYIGGSAELAATSMSLNGSWRAGGPRAPVSPWLDGSRQPTLEVVTWTYVPTGGRNLTVKGGLSFAGEAPWPADVTAVVFEDFTAREILAGASCEIEPGGIASVRGADGSWYDTLFDGPTDAQATTPAESCDGCGATWHRATAVGPVCVDARDLLARLP